MISRIGFWAFGLATLAIMLYAAGRSVDDPDWGLFGVLFGSPALVALVKWHVHLRREERNE